MNKIIDDNIVGILMGIKCDSLEIPKELRDFLELDDQGIDGLDFMLTDPNLCSRIPQNVRTQYEQLYGSISLELLSYLKKLKNSISEIEKDPKDIIHNFINQALSDTAEQ